MKEIIRLKVPSKPEAEFVSHGNFDFELVPGSTIEVQNEGVARWLVDTHGLEEVGRELVEDTTPSPEAGATPPKTGGEPEEEFDFAAGYPDDFPSRDALIAAEVPYATAVTLNAEQLVQYKNIGPKTADAIVQYVADANGGNE